MNSDIYTNVNNEAGAGSESPSLIELGRRMYGMVDNGEEWASESVRLGTRRITLSRDGKRWALTITDKIVISQQYADDWATVVDAPMQTQNLSWWTSDGNRRWRIDWLAPRVVITTGTQPSAPARPPQFSPSNPSPLT